MLKMTTSAQAHTEQATKSVQTQIQNKLSATKRRFSKAQKWAKTSADDNKQNPRMAVLCSPGIFLLRSIGNVFLFHENQAICRRNHIHLLIAFVIHDGGTFSRPFFPAAGPNNDFIAKRDAILF